MDNSEALVSIIVVTYNSSMTVIETLDSIKKQEYRNLELIISDDCSQDTTVPDCQKWLNEHKERFVNAILVTSPINTGVSANCNRGFRKAKGEWLKCIAGDDLLFPNCIAEFVNTYKGKAGIVVGRCQKFYVSETGEKHYSEQIEPSCEEMERFDKETVQKHYRRMLIFGNYVFASAVFIKRNKWNEVGEFDERYKMLEDYPYWIRCLSLGHKMDFIALPVAYYRYDFGSLTSSADKFYNINYWECFNKYKREVIYPLISMWNIGYWENEGIQKLRFYILYHIFHNKKSSITLKIDKLLMYCSIYAYIPILGKIARFLMRG